jgi:hypothetical protein
VVGIFRNYNPFGIIFLFFYGLVLRFASFVHPQIPESLPGDGFAYRGLVNSLSGFGQVFPAIFPLLAYMLVFVQAMMVNGLVNNHRLLSRSSFLPAMAYLLVTSLFPEWWAFSAGLVVNTFMIWIWSQLTGLYNNSRARWTLLSIGLALGICSLFYFPSMAFFLLVSMALLVMRPFRIAEWLVALMGLTIPYYFLFAWLFLRGEWNTAAFLPALQFNYPGFQQSVWAWAGMLLLVVPFLVSGFFIQGSILRMLIQVRKSWNLLLLYLLTALLVPFINASPSFSYWILCAPPFAAFHANAYVQAHPKWLPLVIHWVLVGFIIALNIAMLNR